MRLSLNLLLLLLSFNSFSQNLEEYERRTFTNGNNILPYRILFPKDFNNKISYPLIIFLHGAYEKGNDNEAQLNIGGRYFLRKENRDSFPAIVIFPQCPLDDSWAYFDNGFDSLTRQVTLIFPFKKQPTEISKILMGLIDSMIHLPFINNKKIYIAGLSQGGMGVLDLTARYPDTFAAGLSMCGAGNILTTKKMAGKVSLWLFHGSADNVIAVGFSRDFYRRLRKENADVRYSEYENVFHNCWVNAFGEPDLLAWLFSKTKTSAPK